MCTDTDVGVDVCVCKRVSVAVLVQYTRWIAKQENREAGVKLNDKKEVFLCLLFSKPLFLFIE